MPLDPQLIKDLNAAIALGRKKELPFGICLGKKPEATVWKVMKTKSPEVNGKLAKKEGETGQFTFGVMTVKSKDIHLVLHGKMLPGVVKKLKAFLKAANIKMKVKVFDLEGTVLEADEEDEAGGGGAGTPKPDTQSEPDPLEAKWKSIAAQVLAAIKKVKGTLGIDLQETIALWGVAVKQAEAGAFTKALCGAKNEWRKANRGAGERRCKKGQSQKGRGRWARKARHPQGVKGLSFQGR